MLDNDTEIQVPEIKANEFLAILKERPESLLLLDVRENEEFERTNLEGSHLIPMMEIEARIAEVTRLAKDRSDIVVICRSGQRSAMVGEYLISKGLGGVVNLAGGLNELSKYDSRVSSY